MYAETAKNEAWREREESRVAEEEIDREREQAEDEDQRREAGPVRTCQERQKKQQTRDATSAIRGSNRNQLQCSLPKSPRGRKSIRSAIGPNSTK